MTNQYQNEGTIPVTAMVKPKDERISDQKIHHMERVITDLQQDLSRCRTDIARLKNRISELERSVAPRG